jgi:hypothetical protein
MIPLSTRETGRVSVGRIPMQGGKPSIHAIIKYGRAGATDKFNPDYTFFLFCAVTG